MEKEMFISLLSAGLERFGMKVIKSTIRKLGESYTGLSLPGSASAVFNADKAYEEYQKGRPMIEIWREAGAVLHMSVDMQPEELDFIKSFEEAKMWLFLRVSNHDRNAEYLKGVPHVDVMDLAITFHLLINSDGSSVKQIAVTNDLMTSWGVDLETLRREATISSERLFPAVLLRLSDITGVKLAAPDRAMVLTNIFKVDGASVLFYRETVKTLNEQFSEGCYLIPSSIHELIAIDRKGVDVSEVIELIHSTNNDRRLIDEEDILSESLYCLDRTGIHRFSYA